MALKGEMAMTFSAGNPPMGARQSTAHENDANGLFHEARFTRDAQRIFVSGHSLTDVPFPNYLAQIAATAGISLQCEIQIVSGSSIRKRLRNNDAFLLPSLLNEESQSGVVDNQRLRFALPRTDYNAMVITEQHRVLDSLLWQDTVQCLRKFHDRFIAANDAATTYFFAPWISLSDRADPRLWIEFEKEALPVWQCLIAHINHDIAADGRADQIKFIPTSWALAYLMERMILHDDVDGFKGLDTQAKVDAIFVDNVHLSQLGTFYVAAISFAAIYPDGLPKVQPANLDADRASALCQLAIDFMAAFSKISTPSNNDAACSPTLAFMLHYAAYTELTYHREDKGVLRARCKRFCDILRYAWRFRNGFR